MKALIKASEKSLMTRFTLFMGVGGVLLWGVATAILEWNLESQTVISQQVHLSVAANKLGRRLADDLSAREQEMLLTARLLEKARISEVPEVRDVLETLKQKQSSYAWIGLVDVSGKVVAATNPVMEGVDQSSSPWFHGARNGPYLGDPHEARAFAGTTHSDLNHEPNRFVNVAVPLRGNDGKNPAVLAAYLDWGWFEKVVETVTQELETPVQVQFIITDRNGHALLGPEGVAGKSMAEFIAANEISRKFLLERSSAEIDDALRLGWSVVSIQPMSEVMSLVRDFRIFMLWLALIVVGVFVWLTWLISKKVLQPITEFAAAARRFEPDSSLSLDTGAENRLDEIGVLAKAMNGLIEKLRVHAARNQLFIEHAPVPLAIFDNQMRYLTVSQSWLSDYGLQGRSVIGRSLYEVFPEIPEHWRLMHQRGIAGETLSSAGEAFKWADGRLQWLRWKICPWYLPDNSVGGIAIFSEDITERVQAEEAMLASEAKFRATFEQAAVGIAHHDFKGCWLNVNQRYCDILGYSQCELLEKTFQDITHPDDLKRDREGINDLISGKVKNYQNDMRYIRKDGGIVWIYLTVSLIRTLDGLPDYFVSVIEDISERKKAQFALQASERRLRIASEVAKIGIFDWDINSQKILWSPELESIFGYPRSVKGSVHERDDLFNAIHPEDGANALEKIQDAWRSLASVEAEWRIVLPDQSIRSISVRLQAMKEDSDSPTRMLGVMIDSTRVC